VVYLCLPHLLSRLGPHLLRLTTMGREGVER
jgi:hypothetical protein